MAATETALINGPDGPIELIIDTPDQVRGNPKVQEAYLGGVE